MTDTLPTLPQALTELTPTLVDSYLDQTLAHIRRTTTPDALQALKVTLQGKKSDNVSLSKQMGTLNADAKKTYGAYLHRIRTELSTALDEQADRLAQAALLARLDSERIDITLPARPRTQGNLHPITLVSERMQNFFRQAGFAPATGPEVESDYYNFEALNIPDHHPARTMHDTFYFDAHHLLRTHTSGVQIRTMEQSTPPIRIISSGRVYRSDSDQTHSPMFHQMEGLYVSEHSSFADLKGLMHEFLEQFFGKKLTVRFRPSYFPFTEPSAEVDILADNGKWLEVLGCGMVHPKVLENCQIDSTRYRGFAFGMGIEWFAMLYYGVNDLRLFFQNDVRFLRQFG